MPQSFVRWLSNNWNLITPTLHNDWHGVIKLHFFYFFFYVHCDLKSLNYYYVDSYFSHMWLKYKGSSRTKRSLKGQENSTLKPGEPQQVFTQIKPPIEWLFYTSKDLLTLLVNLNGFKLIVQSLFSHPAHKVISQTLFSNINWQLRFCISESLAAT